MSIQKPIAESFKQQKIPFTTLPNYVLQNFHDGLALGIWAYLISLPTTWHVNREHLMKHFNLGRDKLDGVIKVLIDNYLFTYKRLRDDKGRHSGTEIIVNDGTEFNEKIVKNINNNPTTLKTRIVDVNQYPCGFANESLNNDHSTTLKNRVTDNPGHGKSAPIKETLLIKEKENKKAFSNFQNQKPKQSSGYADVTKRSDSWGAPPHETQEEANRKFKAMMQGYGKAIELAPRARKAG